MWGAGAWALLGFGASALVRAAVTPFGSQGLSSAGLPKLAVSSREPYRAESLSVVVAGHDPFRQERRQAAAAYDPIGSNAPPPAAPPKPSLTLVGVVAGNDPTAVIEGLPGVEGPHVVRIGDTVAGLRVRRIDANSVRITGMDTVWVLAVREPWK